MTDKKDILVEQFLKGNRQEIPDNGFTKKVMRQLPDDTPFVLSRRLTILCWGMGIVVLLSFFLTGNFHLNLYLPARFVHFLHDIQSPALVGKLFVTNFKLALLMWLVTLAVVFTFAYRQYKAALK